MKRELSSKLKQPGVGKSRDKLSPRLLDLPLFIRLPTLRRAAEERIAEVYEGVPRIEYTRSMLVKIWCNFDRKKRKSVLTNSKTVFDGTDVYVAAKGRLRIPASDLATFLGLDPVVVFKPYIDDAKAALAKAASKKKKAAKKTVKPKPNLAIAANGITARKAKPIPTATTVPVVPTIAVASVELPTITVTPPPAPVRANGKSRPAVPPVVPVAVAQPAPTIVEAVVSAPAPVEPPAEATGLLLRLAEKFPALGAALAAQGHTTIESVFAAAPVEYRGSLESFTRRAEQILEAGHPYNNNTGRLLPVAYNLAHAASASGSDTLISEGRASSFFPESAEIKVGIVKRIEVQSSAFIALVKARLLEARAKATTNYVGEPTADELASAMRGSKRVKPNERESSGSKARAIFNRVNPVVEDGRLSESALLIVTALAGKTDKLSQASLARALPGVILTREVEAVPETGKRRRRVGAAATAVAAAP